MRFRLKHTHFRIDLLFLLFPCIAGCLGQGRMVWLLMLSLIAHETAHLAAAHILNVPIHSVRLTPFGGLAQIENPYLLTVPRLCAVSAAGPSANLLLILTGAALCHWRLLSPATGSLFIQINLLLMLFNLLPALPLDGGRILYGCLSIFMPCSRAVKIGIILGRILACTLLLLAIWGISFTGSLNLSPVFAALYILISAEDERKALTDSRLRTLLDSARPLTKPVSAEIVAIDSSIAPETALRAARPGHATLFAVYQNDEFSNLIDERTLLARIIENA